MDREQYLEEIRVLHQAHKNNHLFEAVIKHMKDKIKSVPDFDQIIVTNKLALYALISLLENNHNNGLVENLPVITMEVFALTHRLKYPNAKF